MTACEYPVAVPINSFACVARPLRLRSRSESTTPWRLGLPAVPRSAVTSGREGGGRRSTLGSASRLRLLVSRCPRSRAKEALYTRRKTCTSCVYCVCTAVCNADAPVLQVSGVSTFAIVPGLFSLG
jgi:hypothetical protein